MNYFCVESLVSKALMRTGLRTSYGWRR